MIHSLEHVVCAVIPSWTLQLFTQRLVVWHLALLPFISLGLRREKNATCVLKETKL